MQEMALPRVRVSRFKNVSGELQALALHITVFLLPNIKHLPKASNGTHLTNFRKHFP